MRERLFNVIRNLEKCGWHHNAVLVVELRRIAESDTPDIIDDVMEAFRCA